MASPESTWSIRTLLNPVTVRLLIYGTNPFDIERVLRRVEQAPYRTARQLEAKWLAEWEVLATEWRKRSDDAWLRGKRATALTLALQAASCRLAQFLINPGEVSARRELYLRYAAEYQSAAQLFTVPVTAVRIPVDGSRTLAAHVHLPDGRGPHPVVAILSGLGSCKEEMNVLARRMVERGVAALVPDMPGSGETLFSHQVSCGSDNLSAAFRAIAQFCGEHADLDAARLGVAGLCMGGGYAYRACFEDRRFRFCATLFPLFINAVDDDATPQWMKSGPWYDLQSGGMSVAQFRNDVGWREEYRIDCPFLMVHSKHDNWMPLERAMVLYDRATSADRELILIEEEPAYSTGESVTHTMPVGEQMTWVGPVLADWIAQRAGVAA